MANYDYEIVIKLVLFQPECQQTLLLYCHYLLILVIDLGFVLYIYMYVIGISFNNFVKRNLI